MPQDDVAWSASKQSGLPGRAHAEDHCFFDQIVVAKGISRKQPSMLDTANGPFGSRPLMHVNAQVLTCINLHSASANMAGLPPLATAVDK
jgi:hypothetical protein